MSHRLLAGSTILVEVFGCVGKQNEMTRKQARKNGRSNESKKERKKRRRTGKQKAGKKERKKESCKAQQQEMAGKPSAL